MDRACTSHHLQSNSSKAQKPPQPLWLLKGRPCKLKILKNQGSQELEICFSIQDRSKSHTPNFHTRCRVFPHEPFKYKFQRYRYSGSQLRTWTRFKQLNRDGEKGAQRATTRAQILSNFEERSTQRPIHTDDRKLISSQRETDWFKSTQTRGSASDSLQAPPRTPTQTILPYLPIRIPRMLGLEYALNRSSAQKFFNFLKH